MRKLILISLVFTILLLSSCNSDSQVDNVDVDNQIPSSSEDSEVIPKENTVLNEPETTEVKTSLFSNDITSNSKSLLPTIDDFAMGWEITKNEAKDSSTWSVEDQERVNDRGFIEGYYLNFQIGTESLSDIENVEKVKFSISLYSKDKVIEVLNDNKKEIELGERKYNYTEEQEDYVMIIDGEELECDTAFFETECDWVTTLMTIEEVVKLSYLKNPNIGDESLFWSETEENEFWGDIKTYHLAFVEKNVYIELTCESLNTEKSINNCIENAELVSKNI